MSKNLKTILGILGVLILVYGLWYFKSIVTYVIISAVISLIGTPIVNKLCKIKIGKKFIPQSAAALAALTLMIASLVAMVSLFAPLLAEQAQVFSNIDVEKTAESFEQPLSETEAWLSQFNLSGDERSNKEFFIDKMQGLVDFQQIGATFNNLFGVIGNAFIAFFSILFISFFFLKDSGTVAKIVKTITPDQHLTKIDE
ncbi:MAG: AI-2E family transporter, partial [Flavobacteriales bacterium]